ncbi:Transposase [Cordylochernes scorpioides]|uniref:Transposase n=1 Tax=Cordylochernes scorpioides TaxID=51811 RepID=A0ABY6KNH9_9ARAC|nr:Transposase [Cordylochernes scorpioides]
MAGGRSQHRRSEHEGHNIRFGGGPHTDDGSESPRPHRHPVRRRAHSYEGCQLRSLVDASRLDRILNAIQRLPLERTPGWDELPCKLIVVLKNSSLRHSTESSRRLSRSAAWDDYAVLVSHHPNCPQHVRAPTPDCPAHRPVPRRWEEHLKLPFNIGWSSLRRCACSGHNAGVAVRLVLHALLHPAHSALEQWEPGWVFRHGLDDDVLAILASVKTGIHRYFLGMELRSESTEFYIQDVLRLGKEVDPQMSDEDKISHLMKGIAEEVYQALLPRNVQNTEQFITECRRVEALRHRRVTPTKYERLPNVASLFPLKLPGRYQILDSRLTLELPILKLSIRNKEDDVTPMNDGQLRESQSVSTADTQVIFCRRLIDENLRGTYRVNTIGQAIVLRGTTTPFLFTTERKHRWSFYTQGSAEPKNLQVQRMSSHRKRRQFKQTDAFTRGMVIGLKRAGWSIRQIAADTHLGASTVHRLWRRWLEQGNVAIYRNVGATRVTSARVDRRILRQAVAAPQATCTAILQHVQDTLDHSISTRTISRRLVANGLHSCRPLRRLPLTPPNRRQRLEWCRARSTWMTEWHRVVFSDESRFCLSSDSRRVRVWRRRGERSNPAAIVERPTVRQRGIMVWGAIAYDSRSPLLRIKGTMTAQRYVDDVLRPVTLPYLQGVPNALYQQDNARPHTARISQQALQDVQMLPWPPYSPDLSPIEHVWDIIGRRLHALPQPRSEDELWQMVEREWRAIPQDAIRTLIDSLPRRVAACIAVRGGPTCY